MSVEPIPSVTESENDADARPAGVQPSGVGAALSWARRNGFSDAGLSLIWLLLAFFLFQITAGVVAAGLLLASGDLQDPAGLLEAMNRRLDLVFIGNSAGQILFLGLATWLVVRLHTDARLGRSGYMRIQRGEAIGFHLAAAAALFIAVQPFIWYLGYLNAQLPIPETFTELQRSQREMIEGFLALDGTLFPALLNIALVPSICEEILFRGYLQRSFERSVRPWIAIVITGLLFGLYHVQLANVLPLATLGMMLAYLTWASGSIWPAVLAHFVNNGGAVLSVKFLPDSWVSDMSPDLPPPLWLVGLSLLVSGVIMQAIRNRSRRAPQGGVDGMV
jgi:membrane protease YdiL (CAAX protease family)